MKHKLILPHLIFSVMLCSQANANNSNVTPKPDISLAKPDYRKGVLVKELINPNLMTRYESQQTSGDKPLYNELFTPNLQQWIKAKGKLQADPSGLIYEKDYQVTAPTQFIQTVPELIEKQYFYRQSLHAELMGTNAKSILAFTHSKGGKVFVSTRFNKVYEPKSFMNEADHVKEYSQCVDISARITVTNVPTRNSFSVETLVDYWQDFEIPVCHTNSNES